jgi:beta-glucosidase
LARSVGQVPISYNHKPSGAYSNWYGNYVDMPVTPLYPFGHGLSYTSFCYSDMQLSRKTVQSGEQVDISLTVTNTGQLAGDEVVQLYVRDEIASIPRPVKELKGFYRLHLEPGQSRRLTFHLPADLLAYYDENLDLILERGKIHIMLGSSSVDIHLQDEFEIIGCDKATVAQRLFSYPVTIH